MKMNYTRQRFFSIFLFMLNVHIIVCGCSSNELNRSGNSFEEVCIDVVIPVCQKDLRTLDYALMVLGNMEGVSVALLLFPTSRIRTRRSGLMKGDNPFSKKDVEQKISELLPAGHPYDGKRNGWVYQQLLKFYAPFIIPGIASNVLVLDADTIFLRSVSFIDQDGTALYNVGTEYCPAYFQHAKKLINDRPITKVFREYSGICNHMLFQRPVLDDLFAEIRKNHNMEPWQALLTCINPDALAFSCMSEYEIYFNFIFSRKYNVKIRKLMYEDCGFSLNKIRQRQMDEFHYISCHAYRP